MTLLHELKFALRSLARAKGLAATVVLTLALGIGANASIFSVVRGVLLRPLVNRDESRLIYIRQSAPGTNNENAAFSVPEILDLRSRLKSVSSIGDFSQIGFTMVGLGEPRQIRAGVVDGSYFEVMGLRPVIGRLLNEKDDGPNAAGAAVLTHRFWTTGLHGDPTVIGKTIRLGTRSATIVGVLEPSVPYPAETEIFANVVTSPHHLSATMVTGREHRMTELFARLAPGADVDSARAELRAVHARDDRGTPRSVPAEIRLPDRCGPAARSDHLQSAHGAARAARRIRPRVRHRRVERREPDPRAIACGARRELAVRAALGASSSTLRRTLLAESLVLCGTGAVLGVAIAQPMVTVLGRYAARFSVRALDLTLDASILWVGVGLALLAAVLLAFVPRLPNADASHGFALSSGGLRITGATSRRLRMFAVTQIAASFMLLAGAGHAGGNTAPAAGGAAGIRDAKRARGQRPCDVVRPDAGADSRLLPRSPAARQRVARRRAGRVRQHRAMARRRRLRRRPCLHGRRRASARTRPDDPRARSRSVSPGFFAALGMPIVAGRDFNDGDRIGCREGRDHQRQHRASSCFPARIQSTAT